jgi:hypothetical protein
MAEYCSAMAYLKCVSTPAQKIKKIDEIIDVLLNTVLTAVESGHVEEYSLDDGQTKINQIFRSPDAVIESIKTLEEIRQLYVNRCKAKGSRIVKLMDISNFRRHGRY